MESIKAITLLWRIIRSKQLLILNNTMKRITFLGIISLTITAAILGGLLEPIVSLGSTLPPENEELSVVATTTEPIIIIGPIILPAPLYPTSTSTPTPSPTPTPPPVASIPCIPPLTDSASDAAPLPPATDNATPTCIITPAIPVAVEPAPTSTSTPPTPTPKPIPCGNASTSPQDNASASCTIVPTLAVAVEPNPIPTPPAPAPTPVPRAPIDPTSLPTPPPTPVILPPCVTPVAISPSDAVPPVAISPQDNATPCALVSITPALAVSVEPTPPPSPTPTPSPSPSPSSGGGGGGGGGGTGSGSVTTPIPTQAPTTTQNENLTGVGGFLGGEVLGASTGLCDPLITTPLRRDFNNPLDQVVKLQHFLNVFNNAGLTTDGIFDLRTESAVNAFQVRYWEEILLPWVPFGLPTPTTPTGYVYKTTPRKINMLSCPSLNLPMPQLP